MKNDYILGLEGKLHGYHTRLKELHFSAPNYSLHKIIDEFDSELLEFDDEIMEDAQSIFEVINVGEIKPVLPKETEIEDLLQAIRGTLAEAKEKLKGKLYTGIINVIDDFWHTVNKTIYLVQIAKKNLAKE
jgi:DNA-binding ferritin-like protein